MQKERIRTKIWATASRQFITGRITATDPKTSNLKALIDFVIMNEKNERVATVLLSSPPATSRFTNARLLKELLKQCKKYGVQTIAPTGSISPKMITLLNNNIAKGRLEKVPERTRYKLLTDTFKSKKQPLRKKLKKLMTWTRRITPR